MLNKLSVGAGLFAASLALPTLSVAGEAPIFEQPELRMPIDACVLTPDTMVALRSALRDNPDFKSIYCSVRNAAELTVALAPSRNDHGDRARGQEGPVDAAVVQRMASIILAREQNLHEVRMLYGWDMSDETRTITVGVK